MRLHWRTITYSAWLVIALTVTRTAVEAQGTFPCGPGNCYECINLTEEVQWCRSAAPPGWGDCCSLVEHPPESGIILCQTPGFACEEDLGSTPLTLTPAGTVISATTRIGAGGIVVSACRGYIVRHSLGGQPGATSRLSPATMTQPQRSMRALPRAHDILRTIRV